MSLLEQMAVHVLGYKGLDADVPRLVLHVFPRSERPSILDSAPEAVVVEDDGGNLCVVGIPSCKVCGIATGKLRCAWESCAGHRQTREPRHYAG